jgi:PilZ domain
MRSLLGYLVLDQPRQRYTHWVEALAPLTGPGAPPPLQVDAFFVAAEDRALLALWYLAGDGEAAALVAEVTRLAEIYVIDPACLAEPDRRILQDRLIECEVIVDRRTSIADALGELVRRARELRAQIPAPSPSARTITGRRAMAEAMGGPMARDSSSVLAVAAVEAERAETQGWLPYEPRGDKALGTDRIDRIEREDRRDERGSQPRYDEPRLGRPVGTRNDLAPLSPSSPTLPRARRATGMQPPAGAPRNEGSFAGALPAMPPPRRQDGNAGGAGGFSAGDGLATSGATSARTSRDRRARTEATTDPFLLAFRAQEPVFAARYLRGNRWAAAQLSQLSLEGAQLAAVSLPRLGDAVYLVLAFGEAEVAMRAEVTHVTEEAEAQISGAASFQVKFALDDAARDRLYSLLMRARAANAQLVPPPSRKSRRTAVTWPLLLATPRGSIRAELLDISERGMFAHPLRELPLEGNIGFSLVLDDQVTSVSGRVQVVRQLGNAEGEQRGLRWGYGLELTDLAGSHRQPWERFVARIRRRSARRVLVGAPAARFDELAGSLTAAGYAVFGAVEPASVAQLAEAERRPPDAAVLDAEWMSAGGQVSWMETLMKARGIRCLISHGDPRRSYGEVDRLLGLA